MHRIFSVLFSLALVVCFSVTAAKAAESVPFHTHIVVVDTALVDDAEAESAVLEFKKELIKLAGGYTFLGKSHGGELRGNEVVNQDNMTFIVGAPKDISKELKALSIRIFHGNGAFILAHEGTMLY